MGEALDRDRRGAARRMRLHRIELGLAALLPACLLLQLILSRTPWLVERVYSRALFPPIATAAGTISGWFPFSLAEVGLGGLAVSLVAWAVRGMRGLRRTGLLRMLGTGLRRLLAVAGLVYAVYLGAWGLNHQRVPFPDAAGYEITAPTEQELTALAGELVERVNALRPQLREDAAGVSIQPHSPGELLRLTRDAYAALSAVHPSLKPPPSTPKRPLLSPLMSAWWVAGIYSPFTAEAHVNRQLPAPQVAFTTAHELAHALGFARENEANYLAWLACSRSDDSVLRYSALLQATRRVLGALATLDRDAARALHDSLDPGVHRDQAAIARFWSAAESLTTELAQRVNDAYLRSQGQPHGLETYGMFIDLMIAERRKLGTIPFLGNRRAG